MMEKKSSQTLIYHVIFMILSSVRLGYICGPSRASFLTFFLSFLRYTFYCTINQPRAIHLLALGHICVLDGNGFFFCL